MTALCAGGTSSPKVGAAGVVTYTAGLLAAIFAAYDVAWLIPVVPFLGLLPLELDVFCAADPPSEPSFTLAETDAILTLRFGADFDSGLTKLVALAKVLIWREVCKCDVGSPTAFTPVAIPSGTPITQYPAPVNGPCGDVFTYTDSFAAGGGSLNRGGPILTPGLVPSAFVYHCVGTVGFSGTAGSFNWLFEQVNNANVTIRSDTINVATPNATVDKTVTAIAGVNSIRLTQSSVSGTSTQKITGTTITPYCGVPGAPQTPCCPPDLATQATLDAILAMVTLIQRQAVPFAHILGSVHAGLSGQGTVAVAGLLGVKLELTTIPASYGVAVGQPTYHFDMGWLSVLTPDGLVDERRITAQTTSWLPPFMSDATVVGYSLNPGVVGTLTEIKREP